MTTRTTTHDAHGGEASLRKVTLRRTTAQVAQAGDVLSRGAAFRRTAARALLLAGVVAWSSSSGVRAQPNPGCRVVVLNLVGRNLPAAHKDTPALLTESLAAEVAAVSGCQVVSQSDVAQMLDFEAQKAACGEGDSCLSEIGEALGADRVVGGTLGKLGGDFVVNARLMNVRQGVVEARAEQAVHGAARLRSAAKNAARQLFGLAPLATTTTETTTETTTGHGPLFWSGVAAASVGGLVAVGGGAFAALAEFRLASDDQADKAALASEGQTALAVAAVGGVVGLVGGGLVVAALAME
jgi:TolB-like protein